MSEATYGEGPLTPEQAQRAYAATTAGDVLRGRQPGNTPLSAGGNTPGSLGDVIDLAHYIATGDTYAVFVQRREREECPMIHAMTIPIPDFLTDLLNNIGRDDEASEEDADKPRPVKDTPQAESSKFPDGFPDFD